MNFIVLSYFLTLSYVLKIGPNRSIQPIQSKIKSQFCLVKTGQKPEKSDKNYITGKSNQAPHLSTVPTLHFLSQIIELEKEDRWTRTVDKD